MTTRDIPSNVRIQRVQRLINWGVVLGVSFPSLVYIAYGINEDLIEEKWQFWALGGVLGYIVVMALIGYYAPQWTHDQSETSELGIRPQGWWHNVRSFTTRQFLTSNGWTENAFWFGGFISFVALYLLVTFSGGISASPFTGYFIYVPAVVYITLRDVRRVVGASSLSAVLAVLSTPCELALPDLGSCLLDDNMWRASTSTFGYFCVYAAIVLWQIGVATAIVYRRPIEVDSARQVG